MPTPVIIKKHYYKVYRGARYLGLLPHVLSEFSYKQDINTGSAITEIVTGFPIDRTQELVEPIQTESGLDITDEAGDPLLIERQPDIMGTYESGAVVANGNTIEVYEYSDYDPNGVLVFSGTINRYSIDYGRKDMITISVISRGNELRDYIMQSAGAFITEIQQANSNAEILLNNTNGSGPHAIFQTFTPVTDMTIVKLAYKMRRDSSVALSRFQIDVGVGDNPSTSDYPPFYVHQIVSSITDGVSDWVEFTFPVPLELAAGQSYVIGLSPQKFFGDPSTHAVQMSVDTTNPYASGSAWTASRDPVTFDYSFTQHTYDMAFKLFSTNNSIRAAFTSTDPADIFRAAIDVYQASSGPIGYTAASVDDTGLSIDYTFNLNTLLESVEKSRELAPGDWYWYIDPASLTAYYKTTSATAIHRFIRGDHIEELTIDPIIEDVRNVLYFTGGDTGGGDNLFRRYTNPDSITALGRQRLERISDSNVTSATTADQIAENFLDSHEDEKYQTEVTIIDTTYDTNSLNLGDTVSLQGYGNFVDKLILQIVRKQVYIDRVTLTLGVLPFRQIVQVDQMSKSLDQLRLVDNPTAPS